MRRGSRLFIIWGTSRDQDQAEPEKERGYTMQQLRRKIIELINNINDLEKLKMIYQFIRGLLSS